MHPSYSDDLSCSQILDLRRGVAEQRADFIIAR
jgi:hypothetical protein